MNRKRRFVPMAWLCLLALLLLATSFASAQDAAVTPSPVSGGAHSLLPAPAAAVPRPQPATASSQGPDPSRKWEIEVHGAGILSFNPTGGTSFLPSAGLGFSGPGGGSSLRVPSWFFGAGASLYNTVEFNHPGVLSVPIASLDTVLTSPVTRRSHGPALGARVSRELSPRFSIEGDFEYNFGSLALNGAGDRINAAGASWAAAFSQVLGPGLCPGCSGVSVSSVTTIHDHQGREILATGALNVNVRTQGRAIPYFTVGGGGIFSMGDAPVATLVGNLQFTNAGAPHNETDSIRLHYGVPDHTATGFFGGGVKYYITSHYGIRAEVRDYVSHYHVDNLLDATPSVATLTPAGAFAPAGNPTVVFSNNPTTGFPSSLSAPALSSFRTLAGDGTLHQVEFTFGMFFRF